MTWPLLVQLDLSKTFEVHCETCGKSLGVVISQEEHIMAYENQHLQPQEKSMGIYEKELLVIHALDSWKNYLLDTSFIIRTNHQSIK